MRVFKHFFPVTILFFLVLLASASYYRFMVQSDYLISYEAECNPSIESCFVGCDDDECTSKYYYSLIERHAAEIRELCDSNVLGCEAAQDCKNESGPCTITYCDPDIDGEDSCAINGEDV